MKKDRLRKKLEGLVKEGKLYCKKYDEQISLEMLYRKKCYFQNKKKSYCRYVIIQ